MAGERMMVATKLRVWSAVHRWSSLVCTIFILLLAVTGLPLIFHDEIDDVIGDGISVPSLPAETPVLPLDQIVDAARQRYPSEFVQFFVWDRDRPGLINLVMGPVPSASRDQFHRLAVDARTAQILGEPTTKGAVTRFLLELHGELLMGVGGGLFLGAMALLLLASIVSGVVLYGPFMRKLPFGIVRNDRSRRITWLDLHNLLGIVTVAWLVVVGATGAINTLAKPLFDIWRGQEMPHLLTPYRDKTVVTQPGSVDVAVEKARHAAPGMELASVIFPSVRYGSPRHFLIWTRGRTPLTSRLFTPVLADAQTGEVVSASALPWYLRALELSRPLHFGDYGGLPLKIIWALFDLITIVVLGSGVYLWFARSRRIPSEYPMGAGHAGAAPVPAVAEERA
jgi:uncharacterized iron-regulated membrane protein